MQMIRMERNVYKIDPMKIRIARAEKGWSITKLADVADIARHTVSNIENKKSKNVHYETVEKIAKALGKDIENFIVG